MTLRTFWTIFLKVFGLYLIWQTLIILPSFFSTLVFAGSQDKISPFTTLVVLILIALFFILIIRYCVFQTDSVIDKLHLEKGCVEDKIQINIHRSSLLSVAIIVLGGLMFADGLPLLVYNSFLYIQHNDAYKGFRDNHASPYLITNFLKVLAGYFMIADSRLIVNFIERKRKKVAVDIDNTNAE